MGSAIHAVGGIGSGVAVKLAVNVLLGIQVAAMAEVIGLLQANGVHVPCAVETIAANPVASQAARPAVALMLAGSFAPMFPVELVEKNFGYIEAAANTMPVSKATRQVMKDAITAGLGGDHLAAIVRLIGQHSGRPAAKYALQDVQTSDADLLTKKRRLSVTITAGSSAALRFGNA